MEIGRNDPCPCGSGKKYKKCCLEKDEAQALDKWPSEPEFQGQEEEGRSFPKLMPPIPENLDGKKVGEGYDFLDQDKVEEACNVWLEFWDSLKAVLPTDVKDVGKIWNWDFCGQGLFNWCQDLEMELQNAGLKDPAFYQKRIQYCQEFISVFPESDDQLLHGMKRAVADSHFALGMFEEGDACFKRLIEEYPSNVWGYVGWGDMYLWPFRNLYPKDLDRAEEYYRMFKGRKPEDKELIRERMDYLRKEQKKKEGLAPNE